MNPGSPIHAVPPDEVAKSSDTCSAGGPPAAPASPGPGPARPGTARRTKVLLVDDDAELRAYLREHLAPDYDLHEAARGDEAWTLIRAEMPDAVVADVVMPGLDGRALCRAIKQNPDTDLIPVILLTVKGGIQDRIEGLECGADDYLAKPFDPAELRLRLRNLFRLRRRLLARLGEPAAAPARALSADDLFLRRLREVLRRDATSESFTIGDLARGMGLSRAQLHRRLAETCGATPAEVITGFRLELAAHRLSRRAGNVGQVAYAVGFKNLSHFIRRFRRRYGQTPADYAAGHRPPAT